MTGMPASTCLFDRILHGVGVGQGDNDAIRTVGDEGLNQLRLLGGIQAAAGLELDAHSSRCILGTGFHHAPERGLGRVLVHGQADDIAGLGHLRRFSGCGGLFSRRLAFVGRLGCLGGFGSYRSPTSDDQQDRHASNNED